MPFDTLIDKAQFETALKATADAIRDKTGNTANCIWDSEKGFEAYIADIKSGSGDSVPEDVVTITSSTSFVTDTKNLFASLTPDDAKIGFFAFEGAKPPVISNQTVWVCILRDNATQYSCMMIRYRSSSGYTTWAIPSDTHSYVLNVGDKFRRVVIK